MPLFLQPLARYAEFNGRSRRAEYWLWALFHLILTICCVYVTIGAGEGAAAVCLIVLGLATLVPSLAVAIRRLHDTDRAGAWILIALLPFLGGLIFFVFMLIDGTPGPNRYGPDPKGRSPLIPPGPQVIEVHPDHHTTPAAPEATPAQP